MFLIDKLNDGTACKCKVMATFKTPQWFEVTMDMRNTGLDVLKLSKKDINKEELTLVFGPNPIRMGGVTIIGSLRKQPNKWRSCITK